MREGGTFVGSCAVSHEKICSWDPRIQRCEGEAMATRQGEKVRVGRAGVCGAPAGPLGSRHVVGKELVDRAEGFQHPAQDLGGLRHGEASPCPLHRNADKTHLWDGRSEELHAALFLLLCDPTRRALVVGMIPPAPGDQHIDIQKMIHGKSASMSRVDSTVSFGRSSAPLKIVAPVSGQRARDKGATRRIGAAARCRRNSETVSRSRRALARISLASSILILKEIVVMVVSYYTKRDTDKSGAKGNVI